MLCPLASTHFLDFEPKLAKNKKSIREKFSRLTNPKLSC
jgi:hypothetical protein